MSFGEGLGDVVHGEDGTVVRQEQRDLVVATLTELAELVAAGKWVSEDAAEFTWEREMELVDSLDPCAVHRPTGRETYSIKITIDRNRTQS